MKTKGEVRYIVTAVVSIPVYKAFGKTETYRQATKDGWGTVYRDETNTLACDEDCSASLYTKNGGYFGIFPYDEINTKEMPKQAECAAIIMSDSCGYSFWAEDYSKIHIFVTYDANGLIDTFRLEYDDTQAYDGEVEITFDDLYQQAEDDWQETYRAEPPGTVEYDHKREADKLAQEAGQTASATETSKAAPAAADTTLTEEEIKFFNDTVARIKYSVNVRVPIEAMNHERLTGTNKEALGLCWAEDNGDGKPVPFKITIDEYFVHECYIALEKPYMKIIPDTLGPVHI